MRLTICGIGELNEFCNSKISHIVSILDPGSNEPDCLKAFPPHERLDLRFHDIIVEQNDMVCPQRDDIHRLLQFGRTVERYPDSCAHLLVHCYAGISRSTAAMVLLLTQALRNQPPDKAVERMLEAKPNSWPNSRMIELGDELLGCGGELIASVGRHYRDMVRRFPELGVVMSRSTRLRNGAT